MTNDSHLLMVSTLFYTQLTLDCLVSMVNRQIFVRDKLGCCRNAVDSRLTEKPGLNMSAIVGILASLISVIIAQNIYFKIDSNVKDNYLPLEIHNAIASSSSCSDSMSTVYIHDEGAWRVPSTLSKESTWFFTTFNIQNLTFTQLLDISIKISMVSGKELVFHGIITSLNPNDIFITTQTICPDIAATPSYEQIDCITIKSKVSNTDPGDIAIQLCPWTHPTLASCGYETVNADDEGSSGFSIQLNFCVAHNSQIGNGVYALARCCNFRQNISCNAHNQVNDPPSSDPDAVYTTECTANQYMLGCGGYNRGYDIGGYYPGLINPRSQTKDSLLPLEMICSSQNGQYPDITLVSSINCCDYDNTNAAGVQLECETIFSNPYDPFVYLSCPAGKSMIACMGWSQYKTAKYAIWSFLSNQ